MWSGDQLVQGSHQAIKMLVTQVAIIKQTCDISYEQTLMTERIHVSFLQFFVDCWHFSQSFNQKSKKKSEESSSHSDYYPNWLYASFI